MPLIQKSTIDLPGDEIQIVGNHFVNCGETPIRLTGKNNSINENLITNDNCQTSEPAINTHDEKHSTVKGNIVQGYEKVLDVEADTGDVSDNIAYQK